MSSSNIILSLTLKPSQKGITGLDTLLLDCLSLGEICFVFILFLWNCHPSTIPLDMSWEQGIWNLTVAWGIGLKRKKGAFRKKRRQFWKCQLMSWTAVLLPKWQLNSTKVWPTCVSPLTVSLSFDSNLKLLCHQGGISTFPPFLQFWCNVSHLHDASFFKRTESKYALLLKSDVVLRISSGPHMWNLFYTFSENSHWEIPIEFNRFFHPNFQWISA